MFNLGFFEMTLFAVIALIVLGPDKLLVLARTLGRWYGKFLRISAKLQQEFVSELQLHELQAQFQQELAQIRASESHLKAELAQLKNDLQTTTSSVGQVKPPTTNPLLGRFFLLSQYDKDRRLPPPPFLPNYQADTLLYHKPAP